MSDQRSGIRLDILREQIAKCREDAAAMNFVKNIIKALAEGDETPVEVLIGMANVAVAARQKELEDEAASN